MSASLVGSEMCIRDSRDARVPATPCENTQLASTCATQAHADRTCKQGAPVSYTHLTLPTICSV
eukprot:6684296-Alexandrium_andersonii.AAC.1